MKMSATAPNEASSVLKEMDAARPENQPPAAKKMPELGSGLHPDDPINNQKPDVTHAQMNDHLMKLTKRFGRM